MDGYFIRELEINNQTLIFYQKEIGDVSCVVWDAALVLAKYLERKCSQSEKTWLQEKSVLELGAGLGCVGLTAASLGARVVMTDLPEVMPLLEKNIEANKNVWTACGGEACSQILQWGTDLHDYKTPDIILLADCVYYEESVEPLLKTLRTVSSTSTEIIISQEERDSDKQRHVWENFHQELLKYFKVMKISEEEQHPDYCSPDILVLYARRKADSLDS